MYTERPVSEGRPAPRTTSRGGVVDLEGNRHLFVHRAVKALGELRLDGLGKLVPHDPADQLRARAFQQRFGSLVEIGEPKAGIEGEEGVGDPVDDRNGSHRHGSPPPFGD